MEGELKSDVAPARRFGASVAVAVGAPGFRWYLAGMIVFGLVQTMNRFVLPYLAYEATTRVRSSVRRFRIPPPSHALL